jgi:hypothetical protein
MTAVTFIVTVCFKSDSTPGAIAEVYEMLTCTWRRSAGYQDHARVPILCAARDRVPARTDVISGFVSPLLHAVTAARNQVSRAPHAANECKCTSPIRCEVLCSSVGTSRRISRQGFWPRYYTWLTPGLRDLASATFRTCSVDKHQHKDISTCREPTSPEHPAKRAGGHHQFQL